MRIFVALFSAIFLYVSSSDALEQSISTQKLEPYKNYLIRGTYEGNDFSYFDRKPKSRYDTFRYAFDHFEKSQGKVIVELGTSRSFVDGRFPGCNSDNTKFWESQNPEKWDWGAGCFTRVAATCLEHLQPMIYTVDIVKAHIERCKHITRDFAHLLSYHVSSSEAFLKSFKGQIDLLYMDTGDMTPIEPSAWLHFREAQIVVQRNLVAKGGLILIDDVKNSTPKSAGESSNYGKAKYSLPYLLRHGFELVMDEYQIILRKT